MDGTRTASVLGEVRETITGAREDELAALTCLAVLLDERRRGERLEAIDRRGRLTYIEGAEERSRVEGRPLTADEFERASRRYPPGE